MSVRFLTPDTQNSRHNSIGNLNPPTKLFLFYFYFFYIFLHELPWQLHILAQRLDFYDSSLRYEDAFPIYWIVSITAL